jgi:hypothetical protein
LESKIERIKIEIVYIRQVKDGNVIMNKVLLSLFITSFLYGITLPYSQSIMPELELVIESGDNQYCAVNSSPAEDLVMRIRYVISGTNPPAKDGKAITFPSVPVKIDVIDPDGATTISNHTINTDANGLGRYTFTAGAKLGEYLARCNIDASVYPEFTGRNQIEFKVKTKLTLEVKNMETIIEENTYDKAYITATPTMPDIKIGVKEKSSLTGNMHYKLTVSYSRQTQSHSENFPPSEHLEKSINDVWDVDFGTLFRGGTATIQYRHESNTEWNAFTFYIRGEGEKPTEAVVKSYIGTDPWFLTRLVRQESSYNQFNPGIPGPNNVYGHPNFGSPNGWGLMMPDPPGLTTGECAQRMWNWKENCDRGVEVLNGKFTLYWDGAQDFWDRQVDEFNRWNSDNPEKIVSEPVDSQEGIFSFKFNPNLNTTTEKSYRDAIWIKQYNGASPNYISWVNIGEFVNNPYWSFNKTNANGINYVNRVCTKEE